MNDLQIFKNAEFGEIRTVIIENEPWFVGKDVAVILGYADPNKAIAMLMRMTNSTTNQRRV